MGCIQLCGKQSEKPYYIEIVDLNVYSLEEINYFIYNHIDKVYRDFFCEPLFAYIEEELARPKMAAELRQMNNDDAQVQDFIKYIFAESYYYSGADIVDIAGTISQIDNMSQDERYKLEAESFVSRGKLQSALRIYFRILNSMDIEKESSRFYARISYAVGVIYSRLFMCRQANGYFERAFELYPDNEYIYAAACSSIIDSDDGELLRLISKYQISDEKLSEIHNKVNGLRSEIAAGEEISTLDERAEKYIEYWRQEYYNMLS